MEQMYVIDWPHLWRLNRQWRQWMAANSEFVTPDTIDTLRYLRIECNEAADVELRNRLSKHPRNNGRDNTVHEELADALMLALTALTDGADWYSRESTATLNSPAEHMDRICAWANRAVIYHTEDFGIAQSERVESLINLCLFIYWYPGMNVEAELRKCWHRLAWKHASKAMDSYPEELK